LNEAQRLNLTDLVIVKSSRAGAVRERPKKYGGKNGRGQVLPEGNPLNDWNDWNGLQYSLAVEIERSECLELTSVRPDRSIPSSCFPSSKSSKLPRISISAYRYSRCKRNT
jgi:hypothetical protein